MNRKSRNPLWVGIVAVLWAPSVTGALPGAAYPGGPPQLEPYTETIAGTVVTFDMIAMPGGRLEVPAPIAAASAAESGGGGAGPGREGGQAGATIVLEVGDFWIGKTEVTWDEYDVWQLGLDHEPTERRRIDAESRPSRPYGAPDWGFGHAGFAALSVTAHAAEQYAAWLSEKTGKSYRLPTADEWRYACYLGLFEGDAEQPGTAGLPPAVDREKLDTLAWHAGNAERATHPVASKQPSTLGIHDMLGNAGEWALDASGVAALHGGSYRDDPAEIHCGTRAEQIPAWNRTDPQIPKSTWWLSDGPFAGFRILRDPAGDGGLR